MKQPIIELKGISKSFDGVNALKNISLDIKLGTIHSIVGENGAGKSTLGKIIAGVYKPDNGTILLNGEEVTFNLPRDALIKGIAMISQEVSLIPKRTVIENVFLGNESTKCGIVKNKELFKRYEELVNYTGLYIEPDTIVSTLCIAEQKKVEVLRAIAQDARLIVMDEPTAALSLKETEMLYSLIRGLKRIGKTIIYVSHFLDEVLMLSDNVTILRNGMLIRTSMTMNETSESLVEAMLGGFVSVGFPEKIFPDQAAANTISIKNLNRKGFFEGISFNIKAGEILGFAGLAGSGRTEICRAIFGADTITNGVITILGVEKKIKSPYEAVKSGIALLPESRKLEGLIMSSPSTYNITLPHLSKISIGPLLKLEEEQRKSRKLLSRLKIKMLSPNANVGSLSGGNQQKVLFAKWLFQKPCVFIADEPTAGVDVGAKQEIYKLINSLAKEGMAVLLVSSDLKEVLGLAHRVLVLNKGRITKELHPPDLVEDKVMRAIFDTKKESDSIC